MKLESKRVSKIIIFFLTVVIISTSLLWLFEKPFDSEEWKSNPLERYKMVDYLIESQILMDKPMDEVIQILGYPTSRSSNLQHRFVYRLGEQPGFVDSKDEHLLILFENRKVVEVTLAIE